MNLRVESGVESGASLKGKTMASTMGSASGLILLMRLLARRVSTLDIGIPRRVSGLSEPYVSMAS